MLLEKVIAGVGVKQFIGNIKNVNALRIEFDTRKNCEDALFCCLSGGETDGHLFAENAVRQGAVAILCEKRLTGVGDVPQIIVEDSRSALSFVSANFYGNPQNKLKTIAVVGTNGKTSTSFIIKELLNAGGVPCGIIGTLGVRIPFIGGNGCLERVEESEFTTPDPPSFFRVMSEMVDKGMKACVCEVSAHAILFKKTDAVCFDVGVFTNVSQDHLDFFKDYEAYKNTKVGFFTKKHCKTAVVNVDDTVGVEVAASSDCKVVTYGSVNPADCFAMDFNDSCEGISFLLNVFDEIFDVKNSMHGVFNMYNQIAGFIAARLLVDNGLLIGERINSLQPVPGRFNVVHSSEGTRIIIDYAHTPDGLINVLKAAKAHCEGKLFCLFGCGGNRDKIKRAVMGSIASRYADFCVITSDNPRFEDSFEIMRDIEKGLKKNVSGYILIENRRKAIAYAIESSGENDTVLICGKGAEKYMEIMGVKYPFDDFSVVSELIGK